MNVLQYLSEKGYQVSTQSRGSGTYAILNCPFCDDKERKFAINLQTGYGSCLHENKCGWKGNWYEFQIALGDKPRRLDSDGMFYKNKNERKYTTPEVHSQQLGFHLMSYFEGRRISNDLLKHFKIGQESQDVIMFPYFRNGKIVQVKYRSIKEKKMWTAKDGAPALFNRDNITGSTLFITEGEIDAMSMLVYGLEAVSVPFGVRGLDWIQYEWEWLERFNRIYLIFDTDEAGQSNIQTIAQRLGLWRCYNVILPEKDANECLKKDVSAEIIHDCINGAAGYDIESLVTPEEFEEDILAEFRDPTILYGNPTGFKGLDHFIKGWRGSEVTVWSGRNSSGKTTLLNQILINQVNTGEACCIASMEMPPRRLLRWWIIQMGLYTSEKEIHDAIQKLKGKLFLANIIGVIKPDSIFDIFGFAAKKYGVKHFVVDSLMRVDLDPNNELSEQKKFVSRLTALATEYNVHIHLVAHPRKAASDSMRPDKVDVGGTGNITDLAHNVLIMWRLEGKQKTRMEELLELNLDSILIVKKNREWGLEGNVPLLFDEDTRRFYEPEKEVEDVERVDPYND